MKQVEIPAAAVSVQVLSTELNQHAISKWMKHGTNGADTPFSYTHSRLLLSVKKAL